MRIPGSTVVMGLVVGGVFAMAIHDTMAKREAVRQAAAKQELDEARQAYQEAADRLAQVVHIRELYGPKPASLGPALAGVTLGMPEAELERARTHLDELQASSAMTIDTDVAYGQLDLVRIDVTEVGYQALRQQVDAAWGVPTAVNSLDERETWLDPVSHRRATIEPTRLTFARYTPLAEWLDGTGPTRWMQLVGTPVATLSQQPFVPQVDHFDDGSLVWTEPPLETSDRAIAFTADTDAGTIADLQVRLRADPELIVTVEDRVQRIIDDAHAHHAAWIAKTPVTVIPVSDEQILIVIGTPSRMPADPDEP